MDLREVLNKDIIDLDINVKSKDEALQYMSEMLYNAGYIKDVADFKRDIYIREEEGITGIGNGIAIPHGKSDTVKQIGISIGRTKKPIEWESLDENPVDLIFLFCVSDDNDYADNHLKLLAKIAGKLGNDKIVEALTKVKDKEALISLLVD